jgi:hypothetical protein
MSRIVILTDNDDTSVGELELESDFPGDPALIGIVDANGHLLDIYQAQPAYGQEFYVKQDLTKINQSRIKKVPTT